MLGSISDQYAWLIGPVQNVHIALWETSVCLAMRWHMTVGCRQCYEEQKHT